MQHTYVHKDIGEHEEKVVGKLSARMVACIAAGVAASLASAAACHLCLGIPVADASLPVMASSMPFWLLGFWRPKGLPAEKFVPLFSEHVLEDGKLVYITGSRPDALAGAVGCEKTDRRARRASKRKGAELRVQEL